MEAKRRRLLAHATVDRMRTEWTRRALSHGMTHEQAQWVLARAVALAFPGVVTVALVIGFMMGWFVHGG